MMTEMLNERATCTTDATRFTRHSIGDVQCQRQISSIFTSIVSLSARADSLLLYASSRAGTEAMGDFFFFLLLEVATLIFLVAVVCVCVCVWGGVKA